MAEGYVGEDPDLHGLVGILDPARQDLAGPDPFHYDDAERVALLMNDEIRLFHALASFTQLLRRLNCAPRCLKASRRKLIIAFGSTLAWTMAGRPDRNASSTAAAISPGFSAR